MIDVAMLDCQIAFLEAAIASCSATGAVPGPLGTRHPSIAPFQAFATADHPIVIGAGNDALFRTLCGAIGRGDLAADPRFANNSMPRQCPPRPSRMSRRRCRCLRRRHVP
jgi:CoA:oxalate CoA-transferase